MANNYTRIHYVVRLIDERRVWSSPADVIEAIRQARPVEMKIRGDGSSDDHYMSARTLGRLIAFLFDLKLIIIAHDGEVSTSREGARAAHDQAVFDLLIKSSVRSLLEQGEAPIEKVLDTIRSIHRPAVPDAKTIHGRLKAKNKSIQISLDQFRRLLYLYSKAGGIDRIVRVHYSEASGAKR
ncbi:hypothetical protein C8D87_11612 [Lentzea atacamensis]|uniref:Uncharacterized protein n=1 Tax=Lentzea atacamensis TaxID=531938 RepID=A0ABX9DV55_9PSEU|nr:hypothetical protein [Lentzea atacamensis]RAS58959.1 hypothetical protein C8D87_11612 [Lentzea atacamensis]